MSFPVYKNTDKFPILDEGEYVGYIEDCTEEFSKKGSKMWVLKLIFDDDVKVNDYIVLTQQFAWKMKALVEALGLPYNGDLEPHQIRGMSLKVLLGRQESDGNYPAKNVVQNYLVSDEPLPERKQETTSAFEPKSVEQQEKDGDPLPF
jgi:hypothetical protein